MFSNWSGAHTIIIILMGLLGAEHVPQVATALGSIDTIAITLTTLALGLFGVTSESANKKS